MININTHEIFSAMHLSCVRQNRALFKDLSFTLQSQQLLSIEGPNGSGKSSLLRILSGLSTACSGEVYWQNKNIVNCRDQFVQASHYIGHTNGIKSGLSIIENLTLIQHQLLINGIPDYEPILTRLNLISHQHTIVNQLSAGQKRRVAIAKLLLFPKPLWIVDEPLTALDHDTQQFFLSSLETHIKQGGMAVITSHQPIVLNKVALSIIRLGT